jgi:hypothetical protein
LSFEAPGTARAGRSASDDDDVCTTLHACVPPVTLGFKNRLRRHGL